MRSVFSSALALVLLVLCIGDIWLWHRGYTLGDTLVYRSIPDPRTLRFIQLWSEGGGLRVMLGKDAYPPNASPQLFSWEPGLHHGSFGGPRYPIQTWGEGELSGGLGFYYYRNSSPFPTSPYEIRIHRSYHAITFPHAVLVLLLVLYLIRFARNTRQRKLRRLRQQRGLCLHCGYDLRGSSDRCPECGTLLAMKTD